MGLGHAAGLGLERVQGCGKKCDNVTVQFRRELKFLTLLSRPAKVQRYWAFAGLGSQMPANVCLWYQKAGLGA